MLQNSLDIIVTKPLYLVAFIGASSLLASFFYCTKMAIFEYKNPKRTLITSAILAITITSVIYSNKNTHAYKNLEPSRIKQIYTNDKKIDITINGQEPKNIYYDQLFSQNLGVNVLNPEFENLQITAKDTTSSFTRNYKLDTEDVVNPTKNATAKISKIEIYNKRLERIYLNKREIVEEPHVKITFEDKSENNQLQELLTP